MKKLIISIFILTLFSCNHQSDEKDKTSAKPASGGSNTVTIMNGKSETGALQAILESNKEAIKKLEPVEFKLKINDKTGNKIKKAIVLMDLTMPGMTMPQNEVKLIEAESGIYTGTALFTMKGSWKLQTSIDNGKQKEIIFFDVDVS
jgi:nitrogen fixation protein FixH